MRTNLTQSHIDFAFKKAILALISYRRARLPFVQQQFKHISGFTAQSQVAFFPRLGGRHNIDHSHGSDVVNRLCFFFLLFYHSQNFSTPQTHHLRSVLTPASYDRHASVYHPRTSLLTSHLSGRSTLEEKPLCASTGESFLVLSTT